MFQRTQNKTTRKAILALGAMFLVIGLTFLAIANPGKKAQAAVPCYPIEGSGKPVNIAGVPNSGVLSFTLPDPLKPYQACATPDQSEILLQGWVWNSNLGWISLYCPAGVNAQNLGQQCSNGSYTGGYGVKIKADGTVYGEAWGDNVGWITFDNGAFSKVRVDADTNSNCVGQIYGYTTPDVTCASHGNNANEGHQYTYAWSDSVGWIDFDGLALPVANNVKSVQIKVTIVDENGKDLSEIIKKSEAPKSNNSDKYIVTVAILDDKGKPVSDMTALDVSFKPSWYDTVKLNQIYPAAYTADPLVCSNGGAVQKPCLMTDFTKQNGYYVYTAEVTSKAPTTNMNGAVDAQGNVDFSYEKFVYGPKDIINAQNNPATRLEPNELKLLNISDVTVKKDGNCIFPDDKCSAAQIVPEYQNPGVDTSFKFAPATDVATLAPQDGGKMITYSPLPINFHTFINGAYYDVQLSSGIYPAIDKVDFLFDTVIPKGFITWNVDQNILVPDNLDMDFLAGMAADVDGVIPNNGSGLYIYSIVTEMEATYYSNKLPRSADLWGDYIVPPVAVFRGNVYSGAVAGKAAADQAVKSIGDPSTKKFKDSVVRNVYKIIGGLTASKQPTNPDNKLVLTADESGGFAASNGTIAPLLADNQGSKVFYATGDVHLGNGSEINWRGEKTIIVKGGNLFIDSDLKPSAGGRLGLVVLKDQTNKNNAKAQGNIYINKDVKLIYANMVADGAVFPYYAGQVINSVNGEPSFADVSSKREMLSKQQLYIQGNIISQNTIGGATLKDGKYVLGNGAIANPQNDPAAQLRAELYDLNYLRQFTGFLKIDGAGSGKAINENGGLADPNTVIVNGPINNSPSLINPADGRPKTAYKNILGASTGGYLYDPADELPGIYNHATTDLANKKELGATYIYFDPPTSTLPAFNVDVSSFFKNIAQ